VGVAVLTLLAVAGLASATPARAEFGLQRFAFSARNQDGTPDLQAGSHPYSLNTTFVPNVEPGNDNLRDARLEIPPGIVGNPNATPHCPYQSFVKEECPNDTAVGIAISFLTNATEFEYQPHENPVFNLVPPKGVAAEFGFLTARAVAVFLDAGVRTGTDYGLSTTVRDISQAGFINASKVTIWGVPADPSHNLYRGSCLRANAGEGEFSPNEPTLDGLSETEAGLEGPDGPFNAGGPGEDVVQPATPRIEEEGGCATQAPLTPLLTNPTSCGSPRTATLSVDDWEEPGVYRSASLAMPEISGCEKLGFSTNLHLSPEKTTASTPTAVNVEARQPQEGLENPNGLAESDLKEYSVPLPEGLQLNASSVNGLETCSVAQIGYTGSAELNPTTEPGVRTPQFTPTAPSCPNASKIGNVKIKSPLLEGELEGSVYVAAPQNYKAGPLENPFGSLTAAYAVAEEEKTGVLLKLPANILRNPETGQLTFTLKDSPQLPYSVAKIELYGGERAALATGPRCGTYTTEGTFTPWSGTAPFVSSSSFQITSGPGGSACPAGALPFSPSLQTGATSINAGGFSPLTTVINKADGQQAIHNVTIDYPPGVSAVLTGVPQCPEAQANAGTCAAESQIGEDTASVGLGQDPYTVTGGKVYLTGPYDGAPFGLSIVTPAKAGPFILDEGAPVVTRAKIEINPTTAAVSITTGEIPKILDGIPLQVKQINVNINRPSFAINPTSCEHMTAAGTIGGWEGTASPFTEPFQVDNCQNLKFAPKFSASTAAHTSKLLGASLVTSIEEPAGALGTQADIAKVKVTLPKALPSQLKTLQKACLARTFEASPEACLAESPHAKVGEAEVHTPLLPVPLTGNAYLVSHGGEAFPSLTLVLKGDGVTVVLLGTTDITKGITTTTFKTTPDVPFTSFQLTLPQGEYAALGAYVPNSPTGSLCATSLVMPTEIVAQNGMALYQNTKIAVTGCPPAVSVTKTKIKGNNVLVTVKLGQTGIVKITGRGLRTTTKKALKAGTHTITVPLTATGRAAKKHGAKLKITVALTAAGKTGTTSSTLRA
jgi:hypothetical protein